MAKRRRDQPTPRADDEAAAADLPAAGEPNAAEPAAGEPAADAFTAIGPIYDAVMTRVPYDAWVDYLEAVAARWRGSLAQVLDLACGTGAIGLRLARRGARVVGVDNAPTMVRQGLTKARAAGLPMRFAVQDMRQLGLGPCFDTVVCVFDSLNYLLDERDLLATLAGVRAALRPGGLFLFDVNTEHALAAELFTQEDMDPEAEVRLRWLSRYDAGNRTTRVAMRFFLPDGSELREVHHERAYTPLELRQALDANALQTLAVFDAYTFNLPQPRSERLCYICRAAQPWERLGAER